MAISDIKVTSDVEGFSLSELLELLGSSAATKKALAELEKAARKNAKALKELNASEMERQAKVDADKRSTLSIKTALRSRLLGINLKPTQHTTTPTSPKVASTYAKRKRSSNPGRSALRLL